MKKIRKWIISAVSCVIAPIVLVCGCAKKPVEVVTPSDPTEEEGAPTMSVQYAEQSQALLEQYMEVANQHKTTNRLGKKVIDHDHADVIAAANAVAGKLYAYACYNELYLDQYVYTSNKVGETVKDENTYAKAAVQEYYLRIAAEGERVGYKYHSTIKKAIELKGFVFDNAIVRGSFESARLRFVTDTNKLYRFEGSNIRYDETGTNLIADWATGKDWGVSDPDIVKEETVYSADALAEDIAKRAGTGESVMHGNINTLTPNVIERARIEENTFAATGDKYYSVRMYIDTSVANQDQSSLAMLRQANSSKDCVWKDKGEGYEDSGLIVEFVIWQNGLFRTYHFIECWEGTVTGINGVASNQTQVVYSYSDKACDMTEKLAMLEQAKKDKG